MKNKMKMLGLMLCFAASAMMASCSDDEKENSNNPLVGTKWACKYTSSSNMVLEFVSATEVQAYFATSSMTYERGLTSGTYKVSGSNITFTGLDIVWTYISKSHYKPQTGTFSGSILQTQGQQSIYSDNDWKPWNKTWNKQ